MRPNRLGHAVREQRERCKWSPTELARRLAISSTQVNRIEEGATLPRESLVAKLEDALGLPAGVLLGLRNQDQAERATRHAAAVVSGMPMDARYRLGYVLRTTRELKRLTQAAVGASCGLNPWNIAKIENSEHYPPDFWLGELARGLGLNFAELKTLRDEGRLACGQGVARAVRALPALLILLLLSGSACTPLQSPEAPPETHPPKAPPTCEQRSLAASQARTRELRLKAEKECDEDCSVAARFGRTLRASPAGMVER